MKPKEGSAIYYIRRIPNNSDYLLGVHRIILIVTFFLSIRLVFASTDNAIIVVLLVKAHLILFIYSLSVHSYIVSGNSKFQSKIASLETSILPTAWKPTCVISYLWAIC